MTHRSKAQDSWIAAYNKRCIDITVAQTWALTQTKSQKCRPEHPPLRMAKTVYDWLKANDHFDLVLYVEWQGAAFYVIHGKRCGLILQNTPLVCVAHSPSLWHSVNNADIPGSLFVSCTWHMERYSVEHADAVISPSAYMLDWCVAHGYHMPKRLFVQPNIMEVSDAINTQKKELQEAFFLAGWIIAKGLNSSAVLWIVWLHANIYPKKSRFLASAHGWARSTPLSILNIEKIFLVEWVSELLARQKDFSTGRYQ
ncbi:MAG: glycosyltransferase, partial [Desulfovibrio sp.]|nr:glycosyltransferase [Desulfovibrio sp.]